MVNIKDSKNRIRSAKIDWWMDYLKRSFYRHYCPKDGKKLYAEWDI